MCLSCVIWHALCVMYICVPDRQRSGVDIGRFYHAGTCCQSMALIVTRYQCMSFFVNQLGIADSGPMNRCSSAPAAACLPLSCRVTSRLGCQLLNRAVQLGLAGGCIQLSACSSSFELLAVVQLHKAAAYSSMFALTSSYRCTVQQVQHPLEYACVQPAGQ
jgi:hypothetical protein